MEASRRLSINFLSASISHDINQPLTAVCNYVKAAQHMLQLAANNPVLIEKAQDALTKAIAQLERGGALIRARRQAVEDGRFVESAENVNTLVAETATLTLSPFERLDTALTLNLCPDLPLVPIDRSRVQVALACLISNAVAALAQSDRRELTISTQRDGSCALITVSDSGPGISEALVPQLFLPFAVRREGSLGMGLALCRSLIAAHGGDVRLAYTSSEGTTFSLRLPFGSDASDVA